MPIEIFDDVETSKKVLEQLLGKKTDAYLVNVTLKHSDTSMRSSFLGLDVALKLNPKKKPIILYGVTEDNYLQPMLKFRAVVGQRRVGYFDLISNAANRDALKNLYQQLLRDRKQEDWVAMNLFTHKNNIDIMGQLQHSLRPEYGVEHARQTSSLALAPKDLLAQISKSSNWSGIGADQKNTQYSPVKNCLAYTVTSRTRC